MIGNSYASSHQSRYSCPISLCFFKLFALEHLIFQKFRKYRYKSLEQDTKSAKTEPELYHYSNLSYKSHRILDVFPPSYGVNLQKGRYISNNPEFLQLLSVGTGSISYGHALIKKNYFLYGRLFLEDWRLEALVSHRLARNLHAVISGISSFRPNASHAS